MDTVTMTGLQMNELAMEIADHYGGARGGPPGTRAHPAHRRTDHRRRRRDRGRLRRRTRLGRDLHGGPRERGLRPAPDRRRSLAGSHRLDRPSRHLVHGLAVCGLGDLGGEVLRDGLGAAPGAREGGARAVREARLRGRGRPAGSSCSRDARCRRTRSRDGSGRRHGCSRRSSRSSSRPPRVWPGACRSRPAFSRRVFTRWKRSASTCAEW